MQLPACLKLIMGTEGVPKCQNTYFTFYTFLLQDKQNNILTSKLYKVTKSAISPQRKLESLWYLKIHNGSLLLAPAYHIYAK